MRSKAFVAVFIVLILTILACGFNVSTANIKSATMSKDAEGTQPTTSFAQDDVFYCVVELANAPDDTKVKAAWTAVETEGMEPNIAIDSNELESGDGALQFKLVNDNQLWPVGKYKVDLFLNDKLDRTLEFEVKAPAAAVVTPEATEEVAATEEATPTEAPSPTATPLPAKPTPTPEPPAPTQSSQGDQLVAQPTEKAEPTPTPLPLQADPYVHPSGAFTFSVPEGWQGIAGDESSVSFGDNESAVGAVFSNMDARFSDKQMNTFIDAFLAGFVNTFANDYSVLEQRTNDDGSIFVAIQYQADDGPGDADFIFEQRETVIFILYFLTPRYEELQSTWEAIIDSYSVDAEAALAAAPETLTAAPPTAAPPTPTPEPSNSNLAPQAGRSRLYVVNQYREELTFTINNTETKIPVNSEIPLDLDAGKYTFTVSIPGGAVNGEVEMAPNQSWAVLVDENGSVYHPQQVY